MPARRPAPRAALAALAAHRRRLARHAARPAAAAGLAAPGGLASCCAGAPTPSTRRAATWPSRCSRRPPCCASHPLLWEGNQVPGPQRAAHGPPGHCARRLLRGDPRPPAGPHLPDRHAHPDLRARWIATRLRRPGWACRRTCRSCSSSAARSRCGASTRPWPTPSPTSSSACVVVHVTGEGSFARAAGAA